MIKTFKVKYYKSRPIYFRFLETKTYGWEYLTIIDDELYTASYNFTPQWWRKLYYCLADEIEKNKRFKYLYSQKQLTSCMYILEKAAETTIDLVLKKKEEQAQKVAKQIIKK